MDPQTADRADVLATPARVALFEALADLGRPASTRELAERVSRHRNTVRLHLHRMAEAGLLEHRVERHGRGRPRDEWTVSAHARPFGRPPDGHGQLARWLARAMRTRGALEAVEEVGREIGNEIAPEPAGRSAAAAIADALAARGFAPRAEPRGDGVRYILGNCPYREAVRENPAVVCRLHRGITRGLLDRLAPAAELAEFVAKDPERAGCVIGFAERAAR